MDPKDQFIFRLRQNSIPDKLLRVLMEKRTSRDVLVDQAGGVKSWPNNLVWLSKLFDNVSVSQYKDGSFKASYLNPIPSTPIPVGLDVNVSGVQVAAHQGGQAAANLTPAALPEHSAVKWPQMPPMCISMDNYVEPNWYGIMRAMIERGRHIALAGPPSVGKDTAVIQLAAETGTPLVTIGGDAGFRRRDLVGSEHIAGGQSFYEVAEYAAAVVNGWWVLLTEVNAADADALMFINAQLAAPYIITINGKAYPVHPNFRLFVSYNPGLIGTKPLPQSFKDRFFPINVPFFKESGLRRVLEAHGLPKATDHVDGQQIKALDDAHWSHKIVKFGIAMWDAYERGQMRYQITVRRLSDAALLMNDGIMTDVKEALSSAVLDTIDSAVERKAAEQVLKATISDGLSLL